MKGWSHSDVIRLCHIKPNKLTKILLKKVKDEKQINELIEVENRVAIFRSLTSKPHEVVSALDKTSIEPHYWLRALNTIHRRNSIIWRKIIENINEDKVLALIPHIISKFPNNKGLYEEIHLRLKQKESKFTSNFIKYLVLYYCKTNCLKINANVMQSLIIDIKAVDIPKRISSPILLIFDSDLDYEEKYLSGLTNKKRIKGDILDEMKHKDFFEILIQSFNCFVSQKDSFVEMNSISMAKESDEIEFPFSSLPEEWNKRVIFVTNTQQEIKLWSGNANEKLIVFHLKKIELKNLPFYRPNGNYFFKFIYNLC